MDLFYGDDGLGQRRDVCPRHDQIPDNSSEDEQDQLSEKAKGAIYGAFIGDAAGSHVEFSEVVISDRLMDKVMEMPGGGPFMLGPGQVTDDSELAQCQL